MLKAKTTAGVCLGLIAATSGWLQADPPTIAKAAATIIESPAAESSAAGSVSAESARATAAAAEAQAVPVPTRSSQVGVPYKSHGEPGWVHGVIRVGEERDAIKSLPMTERPYRPLHFYGNTVRRMHYRGTAIPAPRNVVGAGAATILRK